MWREKNDFCENIAEVTWIDGTYLTYYYNIKNLLTLVLKLLLYFPDSFEKETKF